MRSDPKKASRSAGIANSTGGDHVDLAIAQVLLGRGEHLMGGLDLRALGYECVQHVAGNRAAAHAMLRRRA